ncbi:MAG: hypothetical protein J6T58_00535, partial [Bacteroidales bacterium]|nr:hypothetical protein [Bacteroidales bacterium]
PTFTAWWYDEPDLGAWVVSSAVTWLSSWWMLLAGRRAEKRVGEREGYVIVSVEQAEDSTSLGGFKREDGRKYALVFGNEVHGVAQDVVSASDICLEIPQYGTKHSLNVSVSVGIVLWELLGK